MAAVLVLGAGAMLAIGAIAQTTAPAQKPAAPAAKPATAPATAPKPAAGKPAVGAAAPAAAPVAEEYVPAPAKWPYRASFPDSGTIGRQIADGACLFCHSPMLVTQQAKDSAAWEKTINQMIAWGAPVTVEQHDSLRVFLLRHFGPRVAAISPPPAAPSTAPKK